MCVWSYLIVILRDFILDIEGFDTLSCFDSLIGFNLDCLKGLNLPGVVRMFWFFFSFFFFFVHFGVCDMGFSRITFCWELVGRSVNFVICL